MMEANMTMNNSIGAASDSVMAALVAGLEMEFGARAGAALAHRFLDAEEVDFHWDARISERWIGGFESDEEDGLELDRVRILGRLDGAWFVAMMVVDGEGQAHDMLLKRNFRTDNEALGAYRDGH